MSFITRINSKIFYGWLIVAATLLILCVLQGMRYSFGVFFNSFETEFMLSRTTTSTIVSAFMVFIALFGTFNGLALDRYGPRIVFSIMGVITGLSLLVTSQMHYLWQVFFSYSLLLAIGIGGAMPLVSSTVSRWFNKNRGLAIGITTSGVGFGSLIVAPTAGFLISSFDWRTAFIIMGISIIIIVLLLSAILRKEPADIGTVPDGPKSKRSADKSETKPNGSDNVGLSLRQAIKTKSYWFISIALMIFSMCLVLILTHIVPHAIDLGFSTLEASTILSVMGACHIISRLLGGRIADIVGTRLPAACYPLLGVAGFMILIWSHNLYSLYIFAVIFGLCWGGWGVIMVNHVVNVFGSRYSGALLGSTEIPYAMGSAIGSALGGFIYDINGSYIPAFIIAAIGLAINSPLIIQTGKKEY